MEQQALIPEPKTMFDHPLPWTIEQQRILQEAAQILLKTGRTLVKVRGNPFLSTDDRKKLDLFLSMIETIEKIDANKTTGQPRP